MEKDLEAELLASLDGEAKVLRKLEGVHCAATS